MAVPGSAILYARISDDTEGRAAGVSRQVEDASALAERLGWGLSSLPPFVDNDISASTRSSARRPAFDQMIELVEAGEIDGIAYYSSSRLTRRPAEFETIIQLVERTGVRLASVTSGSADLTTADGRMIARILAAQDAAEAERIGERVKRAFQQRREEGRPNPSSRAFGFEPGGELVNPVEAELIREAADRITGEAWSLGMVVKDWTARGVPTLRGAGGWNSTQVRRALLSPRTAGLISQGGKVIGKGSFEAILTTAQQEAVKDALQGRRNNSGASFKQRQHHLAGFLVCGRCDRPMKVNGLLDGEGGYRKDSYIICSRSQYGCGRVKRNLAAIEEYLDDLIRAMIEQSEPLLDVDVSTESVGEVDALQRRLSEIEDDIAELQSTFNAGEMRFKDYNTALAALRNLQELTEKALSGFEVEQVIDPDMDMLAAWESGHTEEMRKVLTAYIDHIKLHPIGKVGPARAREMVPLTTQVVTTRTR